MHRHRLSHQRNPRGGRALRPVPGSNIFPWARWEPSTYGNGVHLYFVLEKTFGCVGNCPADLLNEKLHRLELRLQEIVTQFDVEGVEVRGRCPEVHFHDRKASNISYGGKVLRQSTS